MNRIKVAQHALNGRVKPVYPEIGVSRGVAFRRMTADESDSPDMRRSKSLHDGNVIVPESIWVGCYPAWATEGVRRLSRHRFGSPCTSPATFRPTYR